MIGTKGTGLVAVVLAALLGGCAGDGATTTLGNLLAFNSPTAPPAPKPAGAPDDDEIDCPYVDIANGGAALRQFAGAQGDNSKLRVQISIAEVARQCTPQPGGGFLLKVGVEGRVLLGPSGGPGTYNAPVRFVVKAGSQVIADRRKATSVSVAPGETGAAFAVVEEGIVVPQTSEEVSIDVSLDGATAPRPAARRR